MTRTNGVRGLELRVVTRRSLWMLVMLPVECPHCEATFQLDPDTLGKVIRCPECRQAFTATATKAVPAPVESAPVAIPSPTALPTPAGRVEEFVSVFDLSVRRPYERVESDAVHLVPEVESPRRPIAPVRIKVAPKPADKWAYDQFLRYRLRDGRAEVIRYHDGYHTMTIAPTGNPALDRTTTKALRDIRQWLDRQTRRGAQ